MRYISRGRIVGWPFMKWHMKGIHMEKMMGLVALVVVGFALAASAQAPCAPAAVEAPAIDVLAAPAEAAMEAPAEVEATAVEAVTAPVEAAVVEDPAAFEVPVVEEPAAVAVPVAVE